MNLWIVCYLAIQNTFVPINNRAFMIESIETPQCDYMRFDTFDDETEMQVVEELQVKYNVDETPIAWIELVAEDSL